MLASAPLVQSDAADQERRCQAMGGARARNERASDRARSRSVLMASRIGLVTIGSESDGSAAGNNAPARWIRVQIGQKSSLLKGKLGGTAGRSGSRGGTSGIAAGICAAKRTESAVAELGPKPLTCTWANDSASWLASAN